MGKKHFKAWNGCPKPHHTKSIDRGSQSFTALVIPINVCNDLKFCYRVSKRTKKRMTDEEKSKELISKIHHSSKVEKKHFKAWNGRPKPHHTTSIDPDRLWQNRNVAYSNIPRWYAYIDKS